MPVDRSDTTADEQVAHADELGGGKRHIARIQIRDVLAIESLDLEVGPEGLTISGATGSGKTSILDSISAAFGRSARAEMVRQGTERGELLVVLDDGSQIRREVTPDGLASPVVKDPTGQQVKRPAAYLSQLMPGLGLNPVDFLTARDDKQIRMLADAFPVQVTLEELQALAGEVDLAELEPKVGQMSGLELAMAATRLVKAKLTEQNTLIKRAESQRDALAAQIPAGFAPEEIRGVSTADLANELSRISQHNRVVAETQNKVGKLDRTMAQGQSKIDQIEAEIERLQRELKGCRDRMDELKTEKEETLTWLQANPVVETTGLEMRLQSLDQSRVILGHYDQVQRLQAEADERKNETAGLRAAKGRLESFPAQLTAKANIPIEGLTIADDRILINGLPVGNLSDGERLRLAIQIAAAGAGDLGFVCVDGAERLSEDVREELLSGLEARGIQFFLTEVNNEDLAIRPRRAPAERVVEQTAGAEVVAQVSPLQAVSEPEVSPGEAPEVSSPGVGASAGLGVYEALPEVSEPAVVAPAAQVASADDGLGVYAEVLPPVSEAPPVAPPPQPENGTPEQWRAHAEKTAQQDAQYVEEDFPDVPSFDEAAAPVPAPVAAKEPEYDQIPDFGFD